MRETEKVVIHNKDGSKETLIPYISGHVCPFCGAKSSYVIDSRRRKSTDNHWRRRQCALCGNVWSTVEVLMV